MVSVTAYIASNEFKQYLNELEKILKQLPLGIKEYDLMQEISKLDLVTPLSLKAESTLDLYHKHFFLFHSLYVLRDILFQKHSIDIEISALSIRLITSIGGAQQLGKEDNLRDYYLNLNQLLESSEESVNSLRNDFWERYLWNEERNDALAVLGLKDPVSEDEIVATYRQLAMQNHPDRGGDAEQFKLLVVAYKQLIK